MASEHRIIRTNDLNPRRERRRRYRRVYKGDVLRISRATLKSSNQVIQEFGLGRNISVPVNDVNNLVVQVKLGHNKMLPPRFGEGGHGTLPDEPIAIGPIQEVLDRFPNPLTEQEVECISTFVQQETDAGNWLKYDSFYHLGLLDPVNALTDWAVDGRTATNNGAVFTPGIGAGFLGAEWIDTNYNASIDNISYQLGDAMVGAFNTENTSVAGTAIYAFGGIASSATQVRWNQDLDRIQGASINGGGIANTVAGAKDGLQIISTQGLYLNGVLNQPLSTPEIALTSETFLIGAQNSGGPDGFYTGTISSFQAGASIGVDKLAAYNNLVELNQCLFIAGIPDRFPNPLEDNEVIAILNFVSKERAAGNWDKYDEFWAFGLTDPVNALSGFKGTLATNNGATHLPQIGFDFDGLTNYVDSNWNPFVDGINYRPDDAQIGVFVTKRDPIATFRTFMGVDDVTTSMILKIRGADIAGSTNNISSNVFVNTPFLENDFLQIITREGTSRIGFQNGVQSGGTNIPNNGSPNGNLYIGSENLSGSSTSNFDGELSTAIISSAIGFDQLAHYNNLIEFLVLLDTFAKPVIDSFPNPLTTGEEDAVRKLVNAMVLSGNWFKMDSFAAFNMQDPVNALWDWKRKVAMISTGAIHTPGIGFGFNGTTAFIDTVFIPSVDGINYKQNDTEVDIFIVSNQQVTTGFVNLIGTLDVAITGQTIIGQQLSNEAVASGSQSFIGNATLIGQLTGALPNTLYSSVRNNSADFQLYQDGVEVATRTEGSSVISDRSFYIGGRNAGILDLPSAFTGSSFKASAAIGFDNVDYNDSLREFNAALEAENIIASFPNPLTPLEEDLIRAMVEAQILSGNWQKMDSFAHFGLVDPANALWDWKRKVSMVNTAAVHQPGIGFGFNGTTAFIDSLFSPLNNGINYKQDDALTGCFIVLSATNDLGSYIGARSGSSSLLLQTNTAVDHSDGFYEVNALGATPLTGYFTDNMLSVISRVSSISSQIYKDGIEFNANAIVSTVPIALTIKIGAFDNAGSISTFANTTLSSFIASAAVGFNNSGYYNELVKLNVGLLEIDPDVKAIFDRMPTELTSNEKTAIGNFVINEKAAGNWVYDEIQCYSLSDEANALTGFLGVASATNSGATKQANGFLFGATPSRLKSGFNPSLNAANYTLTAGSVSIFIQVYPNSGVGFIYGEDGYGADVLFRANLSRINNITGTYGGTLTLPNLETTIRDSGVITLYEDGVSLANPVSSGLGGALANGEIHIGGSNRNGVGDILSAEGAVAAFWSIGGVFASPSLHNTNVRRLLTDLGAI